MRKIFKILIGLLTLFILFLGLWLGINLWPRELEPPLWTLEDLSLPEDKEQNGYHLLLQLRDNPNLSGEALQLPEDLDPLPHLGETAALDWEAIKKLKPVLSAAMQEKATALQEYRKLLEFRQFITNGPMSYDMPKPAWMKLRDLHSLGILYVIDQVLDGDSDTAHAFWLKIFQMDQALMASERTLIGHMVTMSNLKYDLEILASMNSSPSSGESEKVIQALRDFDPEKINLRRALISEYLGRISLEDVFDSRTLDDIVGLFKPLQLSKSQESESTYAELSVAAAIKLVFNRAPFRRSINEKFRKLSALIDHPETIPKEEEILEKTERAWFWWFYNPLGKIFQGLSSHVGVIQRFYENKEELRKTHSQLLAQPLFPTAPVTVSAETQTQSTIIPPETLPGPTEVIQAKLAVAVTEDDAEKILSDIRMVPNYDNGESAGFKVLALKPGSLFQQIGYRRGDILLSIDGEKLEPSTFKGSVLFKTPSTVLINRDGRLVEIQIRN